MEEATFQERIAALRAETSSLRAHNEPGENVEDEDTEEMAPECPSAPAVDLLSGYRVTEEARLLFGRVFDRYDMDKNGLLSREEWKQLLADMRIADLDKVEELEMRFAVQRNEQSPLDLPGLRVIPRPELPTGLGNLHIPLVSSRSASDTSQEGTTMERLHLRQAISTVRRGITGIKLDDIARRIMQADGREVEEDGEYLRFDDEDETLRRNLAHSSQNSFQRLTRDQFIRVMSWQARYDPVGTQRQLAAIGEVVSLPKSLPVARSKKIDEHFNFLKQHSNKSDANIEHIHWPFMFYLLTGFLTLVVFYSVRPAIMWTEGIFLTICFIPHCLFVTVSKTLEKNLAVLETDSDASKRIRLGRKYTNALRHIVARGYVPPHTTQFVDRLLFVSAAQAMELRSSRREIKRVHSLLSGDENAAVSNLEQNFERNRLVRIFRRSLEHLHYILNRRVRRRGPEWWFQVQRVVFKVLSGLYLGIYVLAGGVMMAWFALYWCVTYFGPIIIVLGLNVAGLFIPLIPCFHRISNHGQCGGGSSAGNFIVAWNAITFTVVFYEFAFYVYRNQFLITNLVNIAKHLVSLAQTPFSSSVDFKQWVRVFRETQNVVLAYTSYKSCPGVALAICITITTAVVFSTIFIIITLVSWGIATVPVWFQIMILTVLTFIAACMTLYSASLVERRMSESIDVLVETQLEHYIDRDGETLIQSMPSEFSQVVSYCQSMDKGVFLLDTLSCVSRRIDGRFTFSHNEIFRALEILSGAFPITTRKSLRFACTFLL